MDESGEIVEAGCTFVHRHPLLLCSIVFLAFLYAFFYPLFAFLLASSPVLILTAFLLGIVLLHSVPQDPHDQHHLYKKIQSRPPQCHKITTETHHHHHHQQRPSPGSPSTSSSDSDDNPPPAMSTATSLASFPDADDSDSEDSEPDRPPDQKHHHHDRRASQEVVHAMAWTADDAKSIENIGSLELERNAAVEKVMSQRLASSPRPHPAQHQHGRSHVATTRKKSNPFDLDDDDDFPGSAPSMLIHPASCNPFFDDDDESDLLPLHAPPQAQHQQSSSSSSLHPRGAPAAAQKKNAVLFRRHESFTVGAPHASDFRPSRFRPYFVIEKMQGQSVTVPEASGGGKSSPSSSSSSSSSFSAGTNAYASVSANKEEEAVEREEALAEAEAAAMLEAKTDDHHEVVRPREVVALDVELISDSSDDDISLPEPMKVQHHQQPPLPPLPPLPQKQQVVVSDQDDDDEGESFEVESITKQVAAAAEGKGKQADPVYHDYSPPADTVETKQQEQALDQLPPLAPPSMAQIKLASMRRVFSEEEADEPWAAPSGLEETTTGMEKEAREQDMFPLPPLPECAPAAGAAPPLAAAAKKAAGKSSKYKPPSKKAVLGFFQGKGKA